MSDETGLTTKGLDSIMKMLKSKAVVRIGILGSKDGRSDGLSNSEVGMFHEFGTTTIPKRSFLRDPIMENIDRSLKKSNLLDEKVLKKILKEQSPVDILTKVGIIAEGIVAEGFATGGFGKWAQWSGHYKNKTGDILVDSGQLRNSITSQVVDNG